MCLYMSACIYICKIEYRWIDVFIYIDASHTHTHSILSQNKAYLHFALSFQTRTWGGLPFHSHPSGPIDCLYKQRCSFPDRGSFVGGGDPKTLHLTHLGYFSPPRNTSM